MALADRFCLPRLVTLCELYITKKVDKAVQKKVADGTDDVIDLLLTSQVRTYCNILFYWFNNTVLSGALVRLVTVLNQVFSFLGIRTS